MVDYLRLLLWGLGAFLLTRLAWHVYRSACTSRKARQLGCREPPWLPRPWWDLWNLVRLRQTVVAARNGLFPDLMVERQANLSAQLGRNVTTFKIKSPRGTVVSTTNPKNIQAVLATQFNNFGLGPRRNALFSPLLGNGIFTVDGPAWEHSRAMLRPSFAKERVGDLDLEERHNQNLMRALPVRADGWTEPVDLQPLFLRLTLDSSTEFLFGESVNSQLVELPASSEHCLGASWAKERDFARAFDDAQQVLFARVRLGRWYWLWNSKSFRDACKQCHDFIDHYVDLALSKDPTMQKSQGKNKYVFLYELVHQTRNPIELRSQLLNVLLAGRDTTASLLGWLFLLLARHPEVFAKLRRSVVEDFGFAGTSSNSITFANLKACRYLQYCLSEALRLYPVVPFNGRVALRDSILPLGGGPDGGSPVFIPRGTSVNYSVYVMHRDKTLWGPEADKFIPERWEGRKQGWDYLPFNGGPRVCLGQQFAITSASYATVKLLQRFDRIENLDQSSVVRKNLTLTSRSDAGVRVRLHEASR